MKFVLDTNVVSALMRGDPVVIDRLSRVSRADASVPQPVLAEMAYGIERLPVSKRRTLLADKFELIRAQLGRQPWTDEASEAFGRIKAALEKRGQRIEDFDIAIAAHALSSGATLVTANTREMMRVPGLRVEDWSR